MACIPQVPWYGLCNALPTPLMAQVICPLLYITVRDRLFCSNLSTARPQASSHPGSVICGRPDPLTSVHFLYGKPIGPKARLLYTYPYTSVSFDTFISCNSKRMGIQIGVFICSEFCLLCSLIYRLCKMENTRDWLNAVFLIFSVTNRICSRHPGSINDFSYTVGGRTRVKTGLGIALFLPIRKNLGESQCLLVLP